MGDRAKPRSTFGWFSSGGLFGFGWFAFLSLCLDSTCQHGSSEENDGGPGQLHVDYGSGSPMMLGKVRMIWYNLRVISVILPK